MHLNVQAVNNMRLNEGLSWLCLLRLQVYADATIVFPLLVAETFALHADKMTVGKKTDE